MDSDIRFYISVFFRRIHYFALVATVFSAAGIATAIVLPEKFRSSAILLVESPQIPDNLAASTVSTGPQEQLEILQQRLLTRSTLIDIAHENGVFRHDPQLFPDEIVERMRDSTSFKISTGRDRASLVDVSFTARDPNVAAAVVNAYVTEVLDLNVKLRTDVAESTMNFFEQEVERLSENLSNKSAEIMVFKNANIDALPENLAYQMDRLDDMRDRVASITQEIESLERQRERMILVYNATGGGRRDLRSPMRVELDEARQELSTALTVLSEQNPRVRSLKLRIAGLEEALRQKGEPIGDEPETESLSVLDIELSDIDGRLDRLREDLTVAKAQIELLEANVEKIPANSIILQDLERDYENTQAQYNQAVARASQAETGERIEVLSKGERITVLSQPEVPRLPDSPNRILIVAAGIALGVGAGLGLIVLLEVMNRAIRRPQDIVRGLGIAPLAVLPMIRTPREIALRRAIVSSVIVFGTVSVVGAILYVHTEITPLDVLTERVMRDIRSGL